MRKRFLCHSLVCGVPGWSRFVPTIPGQRKPLPGHEEAGHMTRVQMECSASRLCSALAGAHTNACAADSPSSAMSIDVFPEPVGPTIKLIAPRLKVTSFSIRNAKLRRLRPGVSVPSLSLLQVKAASRMPMISGSTSMGGRIDWGSASVKVSLY